MCRSNPTIFDFFIKDDKILYPWPNLLWYYIFCAKKLRRSMHMRLRAYFTHYFCSCFYCSRDICKKIYTNIIFCWKFLKQLIFMVSKGRGHDFDFCFLKNWKSKKISTFIKYLNMKIVIFLRKFKNFRYYNESRDFFDWFWIFGWF